MTRYNRPFRREHAPAYQYLRLMGAGRRAITNELQIGTRKKLPKNLATSPVACNDARQALLHAIRHARASPGKKATKISTV